MGNVVGSNIANVLLILGLAAIIVPLLVAIQLLRREVPVMIVVSLLLWLLASDGEIGRLDGIILVMLLGAFITTMIWTARRAAQGNGSEEPARTQATGAARGWWVIGRNLGFVVGGLLLLLLGANWLVSGVVSFARVLGVSDLIIGLTVVAIGTSLPEIATSVLAGLRGERDIAVGNVVGSNIFNILCVLGVTAVVSPTPLPVPAAALIFDLPVMVATAVACLPIFFNGRIIARWEGGLFLAYYAAYTLYLILSVTDSVVPLRIFSNAMIFFVIPLTLVTLAVVTLQGLRQRQPST